MADYKDGPHEQAFNSDDLLDSISMATGGQAGFDVVFVDPEGRELRAVLVQRNHGTHIIAIALIEE